MSIRRDIACSVLEDAILDRREFLDCNYPGTAVHDETQATLVKLEALLARYSEESRTVLSQDDMELLRNACHYALIWRRGFLEANADTGDAKVIRETKTEIRQAKALFLAAGGEPDRSLSEYRVVTIDQIRRENIGLHFTFEVVDGVSSTDIAHNGVFLGRVEVDPQGVVKVVLPDGKIVNEPFESDSDAKEWILQQIPGYSCFSAPRDRDQGAGGPGV